MLYFPTHTHAHKHTHFNSESVLIRWLVMTSLVGVSSIVISVYVYSSVGSHISRTACPKLAKISCTLPVAAAQSSSDDSTISYVLPVLWTTSFFT